MEWIIWTIGWWLAISITDYIGNDMYLKRGYVPSKQASAFEALVLIIIWIIGIVKFW